jgi:nitroimidazol reductase NimA-like FMN-containing flavoprotein (pyridoxamine 5'-phosphate oxidase superfamily)
MAPFQYVVIDGKMYFHFTDYGKKMRLLEKDDRVCVGLESFKPDLSEYKFVVLRGRLKVVEDQEERAEAVKRLAEEGNRKISTNFLAAHGLKKEEGWKSFTPEKSFVIVKLDQLKEEIGLKSH